MTRDELVACMRSSKKIIDGAHPYLVQIGMGNFYDVFELYKSEIFYDYPPDELNSQQFKSFLWYIMAVVQSLKQYEGYEGDEDEQDGFSDLPVHENNVVNFTAYKRKILGNAGKSTVPKVL